MVVVEKGQSSALDESCELAFSQISNRIFSKIDPFEGGRGRGARFVDGATEVGETFVSDAIAGEGEMLQRDALVDDRKDEFLQPFVSDAIARQSKNV